MPTIEFRGYEIECERGRILRDVLLEADESPHNGRANWLNCRGHGTCGTCAVAIEGAVSDPTAAERRRLSVPPHDPDAGLRLSCQTRVEGDLEVRKYDGFWGQRVPDDAATVNPDDDETAGPDGSTAADESTGPEDER